MGWARAIIKGSLGLFLVIPCALAGVVRQSDGLWTRFEFTFTGIVQQRSPVETDVPFVQIHLKDMADYEGILYRPGLPGVPVVRFYVYGDGPILVLPYSEFITLPRLDNWVFPQQPSLVKNAWKARSFYFNAVAYDQDRFYPPRTYDIKEAGSLRGVRQRLVTLYPYLYKPKSGEQKLRKSFKVIVPQQDLSFLKPAKNPFLLIVAPKIFQDNAMLKRYINHKHQLGFKVAVEWLAATHRDPKELRKQIQYYYRQQPDFRYLVIIGDHHLVPAAPAQFLTGGPYAPSLIAKEGLLGGGWGFDDIVAGFTETAKTTDSQANNSQLVSDHFYAAIDTDDYVSDVAAPDIVVGRISVETQEQLTTVLAKILNYEQGTPYADHDDWLEQFSFVATDDPYFYQFAERTHEDTLKMLARHGYGKGTFPEGLQVGGDKLFAVSYQARTQDVIDTLAQGRGIVHYSGHGSPESWDGPYLDKQSLDELNNSIAHPVVLASACYTGQFQDKESFAESWLRHPQGAVLYWGSMDNTYWEEDELLAKKMWHIILGESREFADVLTGGLAELWRYYGGEGFSSYYYEAYHTFGDPSMSLRLSRLRQITANQIQVSMDDKGRLTIVIDDQLVGDSVRGSWLIVEGLGPNPERYPLIQNKITIFPTVHKPLQRSKLLVTLRVVGKDFQMQEFQQPVYMSRLWLPKEPKNRKQFRG